MVFHWSVRDRKIPQVCKTILADLNNAVVWIVSIRPPISNTSSFLTKTPITIDITGNVYVTQLS